MKKSIKERLITYAEKKVIKKAVRILYLSDEHDDLFFEEMEAYARHTRTGADPILAFGNYAIVRTHTPVMRQEVLLGYNPTVQEKEEKQYAEEL